jgi:hypothetical protein
MMPDYFGERIALLTQHGKVKTERRWVRRQRNGAFRGLPGRIAKSAGLRRKLREYGVLRKEKGQPRAVDLYELVVVG